MSALTCCLQELAADSAAPSVAWSPPAARAQRTKKASNAVVRAQADFRNQPFLNAFVSELGKLPPKRTTGLQQKTHRHLCRQIKVSALPPGCVRGAQMSAVWLPCPKVRGVHNILWRLAMPSSKFGASWERSLCMQPARQMVLLPKGHWETSRHQATAGGLDKAYTVKGSLVLGAMLASRRQPGSHKQV